MAKKRGGLETRERRLSYQRHGLAKAGGDPRKEARDRGAAFHSAGLPALVLGRYARPAGIRQNPKLKPKPIAGFSASLEPLLPDSFAVSRRSCAQVAQTFFSHSPAMLS